MVSKDEIVCPSVPAINEILPLPTILVEGKSQSLLLPNILDTGHPSTLQLIVQLQRTIVVLLQLLHAVACLIDPLHHINARLALQVHINLE